MALRLHLLHPAVVHFPIALLLAGGAARTLCWWRRAPAWLEDASSWLLWAGAAGVWAAVGLGHLAEDAAPHVPSAWRVLEAHEELAWWTAGWFTALGAAVFWLRRRGWPWPQARPVVLALWLFGCALLPRTAYFGGELVFRHGVGVGESAEEAVQEPLHQ